MSDPTRFRDQRIDQQPLQEDDIRSQRLNELESSNAMWAAAGAVVPALVLMFVFTRGQMSDTTASNVPAAAGSHDRLCSATGSGTGDHAGSGTRTGHHHWPAKSIPGSHDVASLADGQVDAALFALKTQQPESRVDRHPIAVGKSAGLIRHAGDLPSLPRTSGPSCRGLCGRRAWLRRNRRSRC